MDDTIEQAVGRAIVTMRENLSERLTVDDLARAAMFSKFHFTRVFQRVTGLSPGRFLSAIRLEHAKDLLVTTSLNVADICVRVGYNSVGTFSSRFTRSVGMSPTTYRRRSGFATHIAIDQRPRFEQPSTAVVQGEIWPNTTDQLGLVFVGLFRERIPEGRPARCTILSRPGPFRFDAVPPGTWYLLAQSVAGDPIRPTTSGQRIFVASQGPVTVRSDSFLRVDAALTPMRNLDPPVLLALLDARKLALTMSATASGRGLAAAA